MLIESRDYIVDEAILAKWDEGQRWWWLMNDAKGKGEKKRKAGQLFADSFRGDSKFEKDVSFKYLGTRRFSHNFKPALPAGSYTLGVGPQTSPHKIREAFGIAVDPVNVWEERAGVQLYFRMEPDDEEQMYFLRYARNEGAFLGKRFHGLWRSDDTDPERRNLLYVLYANGDGTASVRKFIEMRSRAFIEQDDLCARDQRWGGLSTMRFASAGAGVAYAEKTGWTKIWLEGD
jgi:hypothetical protein